MVLLFWKTTWQLLIKLKIVLPQDSAITLHYLPKGVENVCLCKNLHTNVYGSFIQNSKTWKQPECFLLSEFGQVSLTSRPLILAVATPWVSLPHLSHVHLRCHLLRRLCSYCKVLPSTSPHKPSSLLYFSIILFLYFFYGFVMYIYTYVYVHFLSPPHNSHKKV